MTAALRVLIADEDPDSRVIARKALQRADLAVAAEGGYGTEAVSLALETHPDAILVAVEEPVGRPLETAEALANAFPDTPIIIYSSLRDSESVRRGMVFGARDYLFKPLTAAAVRDGVLRALEQEERRQMRRAGQLASTQARGTVVSVTGAKGGIGKSVLAVNLAMALRRQTGKSVAVLDADTQFGDVATMFDLSPAVTVTHLLGNLEKVDRRNLRDYTTPHQAGIDVFAAPEEEDTWERYGPEGVRRVIDQLAQVYEFVVIDTSGAFDSFVRACISASTLALVVTSGDVSSVRDAAAAVRRTERWGIDAARIRLVLNESNRDADVTPAQVEAAVGLPVFWKLPFDRGVSRSVQLGRPVAEAPERSNFASSVTSLALLIAGSKTAIVNGAQPAPAWKRVFQLRGRTYEPAVGTSTELPDSQR